MLNSTEKVYGWSRSTYSNSFVLKPTNFKEIYDIITFAKLHNKKISCRAAGRSYGDNTLNTDQIIIDISNFNNILNWDPESGLVKVQGGVIIDQIILKCSSEGWTFPSMPGTRFVTIAGALSNNIHGKNAYHQGCIGEHVDNFKIILADNDIYYCSRDVNSELFFSAIGGMGLLGIIIEAELKLRKISSFYVASKVETFDHIEDLCNNYDTIKDKNEYSIAWIDTIKKGSKLGRGELNCANFLDDNDYEIADHDVPEKFFKLFSNSLMPFFVRPLLSVHSIRLLNWLQIHTRSLSSDLQMNKISLSKYHFVMDRKFPKYNYFFKHGFFEYQPILPSENCVKGFKELIKITHRYGFYSLMTGLKAYRNQKEEFLLPFTKDGFSITMDIQKDLKNLQDQIKMFYEMNDLVIEYGGRIYLGKTPVLNKSHFFRMYKNLDQFLSLKEKYDGGSLFESNMYRRIMKLDHSVAKALSEHSI